MKSLELYAKRSKKFTMYKNSFNIIRYINTNSNYISWGEDWNEQQAMIFAPNSGSSAFHYDLNLITGLYYTLSFYISIEKYGDSIWIQFEDQGPTQYTESGFYSIISGIPYGDTIPVTKHLYISFNGVNTGSISITQFSVKDNQNWSKLDIDSETNITINKSFKDLRTPGKNDSSYTKTFLLPVTLNNQKFFSYFEQDDISGKYDNNEDVDVYVNYDGINNLYGNLILDKIIINSNGEKYYSVIIIGENKTFFDKINEKSLSSLSNFLLDPISGLSEATVNSDEYLYLIQNIDNGISAKASGITHCVGLMDHNDNLWQIQSASSCLSMASDTNYQVCGSTGFMADSFTPAVWNYKLFEEIHTSNGYSVSGDILDDEIFMNLCVPLTNKQYNSKIILDTNDFKIVDWNTIPKSSGGANIPNSIVYYATGATLPGFTNMGDGYIFKSTSAQTNIIGVAGTDFAYYNPPIDVMVRQKLNIKLNFENSAGYAEDSLGANWYYDLTYNIYACQQYGTGSTSTTYYNILLTSVTFNMTTLNTITNNLEVDFNTDFLCYYDNGSNYNKTYIWLEFVTSNFSTIPPGTYVDPTSGSTLTHTVSAVINTFEEPRIERKLEKIIDLKYKLPNITQKDYITSIMNMFNLVANVDEKNKNISYTKWGNYDNTDIQDITSNLIYDKQQEKTFNKNLIKNNYDFLFNIANNDFYNQSYNNLFYEDNVTKRELILNSESTDNINIESKANFLFNEYFFIKGFATDEYFDMLSFKKCDDNGIFIDSINYDYTKFLFSFYKRTQLINEINLTDSSLNSTVDTGYFPGLLNCYSGNTSALLSYNNLHSYFDNIKPVLAGQGKGSGDTSFYLINTGYTSFYNLYWEDLIDLISSPNAYIITAYFYLNTLEFYNLDLSKLVRIGNQLFLINKIFDWHPDKPTKIELFKITNIN